MGDDHLGFQPGQLVECRSFEEGYFGAWFRGTVSELVGTGDEAALRVRYLDFSDGSDHPLYDAPEGDEKKQLMIRPEYPSVCRNAEDTEKKVFVVWNRDYEAGDCVEWWWESAFWDCEVIKILNEESVQVSVPEVPYGVGGTYRVAKSCLRPGLAWWPEFGWVVKNPKAVPLVTIRYKDGETGSCSCSTAVPEEQVRQRSLSNEAIKRRRLKLYRKAVERAKINARALAGGVLPRFPCKTDVTAMVSEKRNKVRSSAHADEMSQEEVESMRTGLEEIKQKMDGMYRGLHHKLTEALQSCRKVEWELSMKGQFKL